MVDNSGRILTTEGGYPIPRLNSRSFGQSRELAVWFEISPDGRVELHYQRKDTDHSVDLATVIKDAIIEGIKMGATGAAGGAVASGAL